MEKSHTLKLKWWHLTVGCMLERFHQGWILVCPLSLLLHLWSQNIFEEAGNRHGGGLTPMSHEAKGIVFTIPIWMETQPFVRNNREQVKGAWREQQSRTLVDSEIGYGDAAKEDVGEEH
ncbi:hypothetical protein HAX54_034822 [Datura stramonium]|uniref:Uncharacterized protein n=1 Tax=Datura stramonium TaxID=4076 RepID=A0ABS8VG05_DATST|nr:hypothetical protein [Datura stramonium]